MTQYQLLTASFKLLSCQTILKEMNGFSLITMSGLFCSLFLPVAPLSFFPFLSFSSLCSSHHPFYTRYTLFLCSDRTPLLPKDGLSFCFVFNFSCIPSKYTQTYIHTKNPSISLTFLICNPSNLFVFLPAHLLQEQYWGLSHHSFSTIVIRGIFSSCLTHWHTFTSVTLHLNKWSYMTVCPYSHRCF